MKMGGSSPRLLGGRDGKPRKQSRSPGSLIAPLPRSAWLWWQWMTGPCRGMVTRNRGRAIRI